MSTAFKDAAGTVRYNKSTGEGTTGDPYVHEVKETSAVSILAALTALGTYVDTLETLIASTNSGLTTLAGYEDGLETLVSATNAALATLAGYQDGVETLLGTTNTNLTTLAGHVDGLEALVTTLNGHIDNLESYTGALTETAPASDTASSGLNGRLQRIAQRITSLIALLPAALTGSGNFKTAVSEALPAGELHIGEIGTGDTVIDVTCTLDTSAYASGDLLFDTQAVAGAARVNAGNVVLQSVTVIDEDDQGVAFDLYFLDANNSFGTENSAPSISDANARTILGFVPIAATDYKDLGGARVACVRGVGLQMKAAAGVTTVYVAGVNGTSAPTFTASGLKLKLGFLRS